MPKKSISSLELAALVNELQFLNKGKISQIYHREKEELLLQLHVPGAEKRFLKIIPGKYLCLTEKKEAPVKPSGFCMLLRKYLDNAFFKKIYQKDAERIVVFELEKKEKYFLIVELFSKGNIILTDDKYIVIGALESKVWKDRVIKPKEKYIFPAQGVNWKEIIDKELIGILKKSEKKNLATSLATEIGLGGLYAEEVCKVNEINFKKAPKETTNDEAKLIIKTIQYFLKKIEKPQGHIYEEEITPFPLADRKTKKITKTFNEAIDTLKPLEIASPYEKKIKTLEKTISQQEEAINTLQRNIELNSKKGELIYEKYVPLHKLLEIVKEMRKTKEWNEIAEELKKERKIKKIDLKNKSVLIDF
ncbi:MAG: NFACT family protein [Nanoarchaeota archaeon]